MKNTKQLREDYLKLARSEKKLAEMETRFNELSETDFRINSSHELMSIEDLMISSYIKSKISKLMQDNTKLNPLDQIESSQFSRNLSSIKEYQDLMDKVISVKDAELNLKADLSNHKNSIFFSMDGKQIVITTALLAGGAVSNQKETILCNVTSTVESMSHYKSELPLQTAFSDASDLMFYNMSLKGGHLYLEQTNCKTGKTRPYGILGYAVK